jgi:hypothetical protein
MTSLRPLSLCAFIPLLASCVTGQIVPASTAIENYPIPADKESIFDASLIVAQLQNLDVSVLEKESGLIRFEAASLSPTQLDQYCTYIAINPSTGQPWDTFQNWNTRSLNNGGSQVRGRVSISILISEEEDTSNMNMRSNWSAFTTMENFDCNSTGTFEREYIEAVKNQLEI